MKAILAAALVLSLSAQAFAYMAEDSYAAYSRTAESITGDIQFDDFSITFANGETLEFSDLVGDAFVVDGETVPASLYRVATPADPELENGNALCGSGDVTYIGSWGAGDGLVAVAVFTGDAPPESSDEMCASYIYVD